MEWFRRRARKRSQCWTITEAEEQLRILLFRLENPVPKPRQWVPVFDESDPDFAIVTSYTIED